MFISDKHIHIEREINIIKCGTRKIPSSIAKSPPSSILTLTPQSLPPSPRIHAYKNLRHMRGFTSYHIDTRLIVFKKTQHFILVDGRIYKLYNPRFLVGVNPWNGDKISWDPIDVKIGGRCSFFRFRKKFFMWHSLLRADGIAWKCTFVLVLNLLSPLKGREWRLQLMIFGSKATKCRWRCIKNSIFWRKIILLLVGWKISCITSKNTTFLKGKRFNPFMLIYTFFRLTMSTFHLFFHYFVSNEQFIFYEKRKIRGVGGGYLILIFMWNWRIKIVHIILCLKKWKNNTFFVLLF